jgi:hypothetical protein
MNEELCDHVLQRAGGYYDPITGYIHKHPVDNNFCPECGLDLSESND